MECGVFLVNDVKGRVTSDARSVEFSWSMMSKAELKSSDSRSVELTRSLECKIFPAVMSYDVSIT